MTTLVLGSPPADAYDSLVLPDAVALRVRQYLRLADRLLPGKVTGFYLTGSVALGAYRAGRSDIDFVAVLNNRISGAELSRLRLLHAVSTGSTGWESLSHGRSVFSGTCNGVFVLSGDLSDPVSEICPVASHCGTEFFVGQESKINPVEWKELDEHGVTVRGPVPEMLGLQSLPELLRTWNRDNLETYWRPLAEGLLASRRRSGMWFRPRWFTAWGVLGAPRLHYTIATGDIVSKEAAGEYALDTFDSEWHPIIKEGLGYWRGEPADPAYRDIRTRARRTGEFILETVRSAGDL
jgi:hypothetical protein